MNDRLDIALVDTHRESNGTAENSRLVVNKLLLDVVTLLISFSRMVRGRSNAVLVEEAGDGISRAPRRAEQQNRG